MQRANHSWIQQQPECAVHNITHLYNFCAPLRRSVLYDLLYICLPVDTVLALPQRGTLAALCLGPALECLWIKPTREGVWKDGG